MVDELLQAVGFQWVGLLLVYIHIYIYLFFSLIGGPSVWLDGVGSIGIM